MSGQVPLAVLFTMNCQSPERHRGLTPRPHTWVASAQAIDAFCMTLLGAGHHPTLFCSLSLLADQAPLLDEYAYAGAEVGLLLDPQELARGLRRPFGKYRRDEQLEIVQASVQQFADRMGSRPRAVRTLEYSASDDTFDVLRQAGFLQGSVSSPGRRVRKYEATWEGAVPDPHRAAADDRLSSGDLEFLEVPVTTDPRQSQGGVAPELDLDRGEFSAWHGPLAEAQLERMEQDGVAFRALTWLAHNGRPYQDPEAVCRKTLDAAIEFIRGLGSRFLVTSMTVSQAHTEYRRLVAL